MEHSDNPPYYFKCPQCRRDDAFHTVGHEENTLRNVGIFLFAGLWASLFLHKRSGPQIQCAHCGRVFLKPKAPSSRETKLITLVWVLAIAGFLALLFAYNEPSLMPAMHAVASWLFSAFTWSYDVYPTATIIVLLLVLIGSKVACMVFDAKHRKKALADFRIDPPPYKPRQG